ncbi:hypothetical protein [Gemmata sp.]|uniref:hypothetical protein n=1 Tax=Gemmata sp. TaxID=1914242 RepID=UPI003F7209A2
MQPSSIPLTARAGEPNPELLRQYGWSVGASNGPYCVAWRGRDEVVLEWTADGWHYLGGRGAVGEL